MAAVEHRSDLHSVRHGHKAPNVSCVFGVQPVRAASIGTFEMPGCAASSTEGARACEPEQLKARVETARASLPRWRDGPVLDQHVSVD